MFARECFSGCGIFSTALESTGVWESKQYDLELGHDLLDRKWRKLFCSDIKTEKTKHWHFGVDCRTFSMAAHNNQVRDKAWPLGKPDLNDVKKNLAETGNQMVDLTVDCCIQILDWCARNNYPLDRITFSIENPVRSHLWSHPKMLMLLNRPGVQRINLCYCRYGRGFRKGTYFVTNCQKMDGIALWCNHPEGHSTVLMGTDTAKLGNPYPKRLCTKIATILTNHHVANGNVWR